MCTAAFSWAPWRRGRFAPPADTRDPGADDLLPSLSMRIARIKALGTVQALPQLNVRLDPGYMPTACGWCPPDRPDITSVRVHCMPVVDPRHNPLRGPVDVCFRHAIGTPARPGRGARIGAIRQAQTEASADTVLRIEVCE